MAEQDENINANSQLNDSIRFEKVIFEEAANFLRIDNQMASHMTDIVGALAVYLKEHPEEAISLFRTGGLDKSKIGEVDIHGGLDFGNLLEKIVDFFLGDKDFIFKLIVLFKCGCNHLPKDWDK